MGTQATSTYGNLLQALSTQLATILPPNAVFMATNADHALTNPSNDQLLVVVPEACRPDEPLRRGAGRAVMLMHARCAVNVFSRLALDQRLHDENWLTDATLGILALADKVVNALEIYVPTDSDGNSISLLGFQLRQYGGYYNRRQPLAAAGRHKSNAAQSLYMTWGGLRLDYAFDFYVDLCPNADFPDGHYVKNSVATPSCN